MRRPLAWLGAATLLLASALPTHASSSSATVSPNPVAQGGSATISFSLSLSSTQIVTVDVDVDNNSGQVVWNHQWTGQAFYSGQTHSYSGTWSVPASQATGGYSVVVKAFNSSGSQVYAAGGLAPFNVVSSTSSSTTPTPTKTSSTSTNTPTATPTTASSSGPSATASVSPTAVAQGSSLAISTGVTWPTAQTLSVLMDVTNSSYQMITNAYWASQSFSAGQTKTFNSTWNVPSSQATGSYTVTVKVFDTSGKQVYAQGNLAPFSVVTAGSSATPTATAPATNTPTPTPTLTSKTPTPTATAPAGAVTVSVDRGKQIGLSSLSLGVTPTQNDYDLYGGDANAVASAISVLKASTVYQNAHIMGWGTSNPEPSPGSYNWGTLDTRVNAIINSGGVPVITLCCAPGWMKADGQDWNMDEAPTPSHYQDYANLAKAVAQRYPSVKRFQVWNELKGFWDSTNNHWNYSAYTTFYNYVYDAVKSVRSDALIGGPYVVMDNNKSHQGSSNFGNAAICGSGYGCIDPRTLDVVTYWMANKHGGDFVVVDGEAAINGDPFASDQYFADATNWLRSKTGLPVWWAEWYATPWGGTEYSDAEQNAVMAVSAIKMAQAGLSTALLWQPQANSGSDQQSLWTSTCCSGGGQPFPLASTFQYMKNYFGPGTALYQASSSSSSVVAMASSSHTLLVNTTSSSVTVSLNGTVLSLPAYGVVLQ